MKMLVSVRGVLSCNKILLGLFKVLKAYDFKVIQLTSNTKDLKGFELVRVESW